MNSQEAIPYAKKFARLLKAYNVDTVFGLVGIPIVTFANDLIDEGIHFISCRNEQAASYAASAYGYLNNKPSVLLVVGGPGLIHALAGVYNSMNNKWPLVIIAGSNDNGEHQYQGTFQELDQISLLGEYVKFKGKLNHHNMDFVTYNAFNYAIQSPQGVSYIDFPGDLIESGVKVNSTISPQIRPPQPIKSCPNPQIVDQVAQLITDGVDTKSQNILIVIGKGCVHHADSIKTFINKYNFPFLPTPMAKGILPDSHPMNVSSARSLALEEADIVLVLGARINWILHFGQPPKWKSTVKFIQCDNDVGTLGVNNTSNAHLSLLGDIDLTVQQLGHTLDRLSPNGFIHPKLPEEMELKIQQNHKRMQIQEHTSNEQNELNYHTVYRTLREVREDSRTILVMEGANTMDKARVSFPTSFPLRRLDCGTTATMGVGLGYTIASRLSFPHLDTVLIQGDSAFGFSGMEIETLVRLGLGCVIVVMNNSGIYHGNNPNSSTKLSERCRYDQLAKGLGAQGYMVTDLIDLKKKFQEAIIQSRENNVVTLLNVIIEHGKGASVSFAWQNKTPSKL
ncbi:similar to Saccharomyces cerevisiae YEL020C Hypothetical protein with low sequence identity to Pdc1p [Maudiozyma barnettii]|uniref:2-hydroxyacyl-CoA lyase n=1 Tax=Maudiozyma barnettii TaxID=61262 RepID=A0A8H2VCI5_9SACH|nr:putative indolepyruvate decarboxylase family protein [Kazachstania barnettii]CAB4252763.1 similar to Saccharomyces cerevisiae YEL020C Hypothetical protein with low sequence identity to Pdc1p [Kazachstania barnettii]CAD1780553.1 similar to Saccharomyces cerevisiae YEL020C Hypothetical protein with low sequence identity to Pdc1p [Kazachstania barnettii]